MFIHGTLLLWLPCGTLVVEVIKAPQSYVRVLLVCFFDNVPVLLLIRVSYSPLWLNLKSADEEDGGGAPDRSGLWLPTVYAFRNLNFWFNLPSERYRVFFIIIISKPDFNWLLHELPWSPHKHHPHRCLCVCSFKDVRYKLANWWQVFLSPLWLLLPAVSRYFTFRSCLIDFNSIMSPVADHKCFHGQRHWFTLIMMSVELATRSQNFALQLICFTV